MTFDEFKSFLKNQNSIDWEEINEGIVCNYRDGGDYVLLREPPADHQVWLDNFNRTNNRRWRFINGLRWWTKQKHISLSISANGNAWFENGGITGEIWLGKELTVLLEKNPEMEAFDEFKKTCWLDIKRDEFEKAMEQGLFIEEQLSLEKQTEPEPNELGHTVSSLFSVMTMVDEADLVNAIEDKNVNDILKKYPELVLRSKMDQYFVNKFSSDLIDKSFYIEYDDGGDYIINYKDLKKRLSEHGVDTVFDKICNDYKTMNRQRSECRQILFSHMASLDYVVDESDEGYAFGRKKREYFFNPEKHLTGNDVKSDLIAWLRKHNLPEEISPDVSVSIEKRTLPNVSPQIIPMLDAYDFSSIDTKARKILEQYRNEGREDPHRAWASPRWYQPEKDIWMGEEWWHEQAKTHNDDLLLAVLGDEKAHAHILKEMKELADFGWSGSFSIYEGYCPLSAFMARDYAWPDEDPAEFYSGDETGTPENNYWLKFFDPLPYEIKRYARGIVRDVIKGHIEDGLDNLEMSIRVFKTAEIEQFFSVDEIKQIHRLCSKMATMKFSEYDVADDFLRIAYKLGWTDIVDKLSGNVSFWQVWITFPLSFNYSGDFALSLSLFNKPELTQRLAAWILNIDEKTIPKEIGEIYNVTGPKKIMQEQQLRAALAWSRTRKLSL